MNKTPIQLSDHFTYPRLLRFVAPSIVMMIFTSIYYVVDGFFVSNYVGKTPFAALNFIMPFIMVLSGTGFMLGTGGSALVAQGTGLRPQGKGQPHFHDDDRLRRGRRPGIDRAGHRVHPSHRPPDGRKREHHGGLRALRPRQHRVHNRVHAAKRIPELPRRGRAAARGPAGRHRGGVANMVLDALFIAVFHWGLAGAALATASASASAASFPWSTSSAGRICRCASFPSGLRPARFFRPVPTVLPSL